jgi:hypothetical protein
MNNRPSITNAQVARDYLAGMSMRAIGVKYQRSRTAILYRLRRFGIPARYNGAPIGNTNARKKTP